MSAEGNLGRRDMKDLLTPENRGFIERVAEYRAAQQEKRARFGTKVDADPRNEPILEMRGEHTSCVEPLDALFPDETTIANIKAIEAIKAARATRSSEPVVPEELPGARAALENNSPQRTVYWLND